MEPVDLIALAKSSGGTRNNHLARTAVLPSCVRRYKIEKAPSLPALCAAPANVVPWQIGDTLALPKSEHSQVSEHIPLQFTLYAPDDCTFPVGVFVRSIDLAPDLAQAHMALFGSKAGANSHMYFPNESVLVRGWFYVLSKKDEVPKDLHQQKLLECIIVYDPRRGEGYLGEVAVVQELPTCGVVKNLDVCFVLLQKNYLGSFVESRSPDGVTRWGFLSGVDNPDFKLNALKTGAGGWVYYKRGTPIYLNLLAVEHKDDALEFSGDIFLYSDGTMLLTYYFSPEEALFARRNPPLTWVEGYYGYRLYPHGSSRIPSEVLRSFETQMPAWFLENHKALKVA